MDIREIRQKYPQYDDLSDEDLAKGFHNKFYSDIPYEEFAKKIGVASGGEDAGSVLSQRGQQSVKNLIGMGGPPEGAPWTAGTIFDENYLAGVGSRFVDIGRGIAATFSQKKSDEIARLKKEEELARQNMTPTEQFGFKRGAAAATFGEAIGVGKAFNAAMSSIRALNASGLGGAALRIGANTGIGGATALATAPTEEGQSNIDRSWPSMLVAGGLTAGLEAAPYVAAPFKNMVASAWERAKGDRFGKIGSNLRDNLPENTKLTIAEQTRDPELLSMQNTALASSRGKELSIPFQNRQAIQQRRMAQAIAGQSDDIGGNVASVVKQKGNSLKKIRADNAEINYGAVRQSALGSDTKAGAPSLGAALDDLEGRYPGLGGAIRQTNVFVDKISGTGGTIDDFVNLEARLRQISSKGGWIAGKQDAAGGQDKFIARQLHKALLEDMEQASSSGLFAPDVSKKLKFAIDRYREDSTAITQFGNTSLGKMFKGGKVPTNDEIVAKLPHMPERDVSALAKWSDEFDPELKTKVVQQLVRNAVDNSRIAKEAGQVRWDRKIFLNEMNGNKGATKRKIDLLLRDNPQARKNLNDLKEFVLRSEGISSRTYGMGEQMKQELSEGIPALTGAATGHTGSATIFGPKFLTKWLTGPNFADIIFSPNGAKTIADLERILSNRAGIREMENVLSVMSTDMPGTNNLKKAVGIEGNK